tara:strand:- start:2382 stop:2978 length:597 start_codon:yes stop_codon:yes gene_type:complete
MRNFYENSNRTTPLRRIRTEGLSFLMSPPDETSDKTSVELELLENIGRRLKEEDLESIRRYNRNVMEVYYHIIEQFSLNVDMYEINDLIQDVRSICLIEKSKHQRKRPIQIAEKQGFELSESVESVSSSYPSSHAAESMFMSLYLADRFPLYKEVFTETANKIANSRLLSSNNYPTDNLAGQTIAHVLFNRYKEDRDK